MAKEKYNLTYLLSIALTSAMGGLLFGYDWVVIGGAKPFYEVFFKINNSPGMQGWAMSSALVGCIFGALLSGSVSERYGRRLPLIWAALLFILSAYGSGAANEFYLFVIYRLIGGVGIGLASTLSPMYIAEVAPARMRGRLVAMNQLTIVIGILAAQIINYLIADPLPEGMEGVALLDSWNGTRGWRWMFWAELVPATAFFGLMLAVPKSPRFLVKTGNVEAASRVLAKVGGSAYAEHEISNISSSFDADKKKAGFAELRSKRIKPILVLGIVLAVFQQWCGINVIFNYAEEVFTSAGYSIGDMLFNIIITGSVNLAFTLVAMKTVDNWGRRRLMLFGSGGLAVIYSVLGLSYFMGWSGWPILALVVLAIAVYAMSLAPVTWVVLSEIFPNRIRGLAMSVAT